MTVRELNALIGTEVTVRKWEDLLNEFDMICDATYGVYIQTGGLRLQLSDATRVCGKTFTVDSITPEGYLIVTTRCDNPPHLRIAKIPEEMIDNCHNGIEESDELTEFLFGFHVREGGIIENE